MPSSAKISMNKNNRKSNDIIDLMELSNDITRFLNEDQYLKYNDTFRITPRRVQKILLESVLNLEW